MLTDLSVSRLQSLVTPDKEEEALADARGLVGLPRMGAPLQTK